VVGDSLTAQATWPLVDELNGHGYTTTVAGVSGATIGDQARQLTSLTLPGSSDVVVVALGTNNAFFASVNDARHIDMDRTKRDLHDVMMKLFDGEEGSGFRPSTKCVVWVNVNDHSPLLGLDQMGPAFNQALQSEVDTWRAKGRKVVIADWAATSRNHADWFLQDGVHLTAAGERAYAQLIREHVDRCL
jgi:lysophospholipase L1-like esterase